PERRFVYPVADSGTVKKLRVMWWTAIQRFVMARRPRNDFCGSISGTAVLSAKEELEALAKVLQIPVRPLAAIVGGAKVSTKLDLLGSLLAKVDTLNRRRHGQYHSGRVRTFRGKNRCASAISCRPRARSWPRRRPKAASWYCRWTPWL